MTSSRLTSEDNVQIGHIMFVWRQLVSLGISYLGSFTQIGQTSSWWFKPQVRSSVSQCTQLGSLFVYQQVHVYINGFSTASLSSDDNFTNLTNSEVTPLEKAMMTEHIFFKECRCRLSPRPFPFESRYQGKD